jgi:hypothetical protein
VAEGGDWGCFGGVVDQTEVLASVPIDKGSRCCTRAFASLALSLLMWLPPCDDFLLLVEPLDFLLDYG